jgi:hypothetical protein
LSAYIIFFNIRYVILVCACWFQPNIRVGETVEWSMQGFTTPRAPWKRVCVSRAWRWPTNTATSTKSLTISVERLALHVY